MPNPIAHTFIRRVVILEATMRGIVLQYSDATIRADGITDIGPPLPPFHGVDDPCKSLYQRIGFGDKRAGISVSIID